MDKRRGKESGMRGVCLFGGNGTRLGRFTRRVANKHLILIGDKTLAELTAEKMIETGLTRCAFVTGKNYGGQIVTYFGDGAEWGFDEISYHFQPESDGVPSAMLAAEYYLQGHKIFLHLGDNAIAHNFKEDWKNFIRCGAGCQIFLIRVPDPSRFGIVELERDGRIASLAEKPENPRSNLAVIGAYFFDETVVARAKQLSKSSRGETEIIDLIKSYLENSSVIYRILDCFYCDAGAPDQIARLTSWYHEQRWGKNGNSHNSLLQTAFNRQRDPVF